MNDFALHAVSPIDGRYFGKTSILGQYFSEYALIKYRVRVEIEYLKALHALGLKELKHLNPSDLESLSYILSTFNETEGRKIKETESVTNHDVKAVEYYIKEKISNLGMSSISEFVHFGLTSQDINNTAFPLMMKEAMDNVLLPKIKEVIGRIEILAEKWREVPMLARTHGQPASPTTLGKELFVFVERIQDQLDLMGNIPIKAKFGGATGNFNAHKVSYPEYNWIEFGEHFVRKHLGLVRAKHTTQIAHYDNMAAIFQAWERIGNILIDFSRDIWTYISMDYFKQKTVKNEVGSSAMPHKVNPIDFENAEGNLGVANAVFGHLATKLPVSRLQRDLTDSTVLRNIGVPFGHLMISFASLEKGLEKLLLNENKLHEDLDNNWAVVSEAIQNILRKIGYPQPYEALKALTRGKGNIDKNSIHEFIEGLDVEEEVKDRMRAITPFNYTGYSFEKQ